MMQENKKFKLVSSKRTRYLLPNILTLAGVCLGISSIKFSIEGNYSLAVIFIILAAVLDALDGRIARLIKGTSEFGKELDSLTDFVSFGIAPVFILYFWELNKYGKLGWAITLIYSVCCVLRLARFNLTKVDNKHVVTRFRVYYTFPAEDVPPVGSTEKIKFFARAVANYTPTVNITAWGWGSDVENTPSERVKKIGDSSRTITVFGKEGAKHLAETANIPLLGEIPLVQGIRESGDAGRPAVLQQGTPSKDAFMEMCDNVINSLNWRNENIEPTKVVPVEYGEPKCS